MKLLSYSYVILFLFIFNLTNAQEISRFSINFDSDIAELSEEARLLIDDKLKEYADHENLYFDIIGHTDKDGSLQYNQELSENRAHNTALFVQELGFDQDHIIHQAMAYKEPIANNYSTDGKAENRRVEVILVVPGKDRPDLAVFQTPEQIRVVDPTIANELHFASGTEIYIPANVLLDKNGELVKDSVKIELQEFSDYRNIIGSDIPMSGINDEEQYFVSGGMMNLQAKLARTDEELFIAPKREIKVGLAVTSDLEAPDFFSLNQNTNNWERSTQELNKIPKRIKVTQDREVMITKTQCNLTEIKKIWNNYIFNLADTAGLGFALENLDKGTFLNPLIEEAYKAQLVQLYNKEKLNSYQNSYRKNDFIFKLHHPKDNKAIIEFDNISTATLSNIELRFLDDFKWKLSEEDIPLIDFETVYTAARVIEVNKDITHLQLIDTLGNQYEFTAQMTTNQSKSYTKRLKKSMITNVEKAIKNREQNIVKFQDFIDQTEEKILLQDIVIQDIWAAAGPTDMIQDSLIRMAHVGYDRAYFDKLYHKVQKKYMEQWAFAVNAKPDKPLEDIEYNYNVLQCLKESRDPDNFFFRTVAQTFWTTPENVAKLDMMNEFRVSSFGVYNVDVLKKMDRDKPLLVAKYVDGNGKLIKMTNAFLVNRGENSVIKLDGYKDLSPYRIPAKSSSTYGLIAMDIYGKSYKLPFGEWKNSIKGAPKSRVFTVSEIEPDEVGDFLASN